MGSADSTPCQGLDYICSMAYGYVAIVYTDGLASFPRTQHLIILCASPTISLLCIFADVECGSDKLRGSNQCG